MTTPRQVHLNDQLVATGREVGSHNPDAAVFSITVGGEGLDCSWCDCPTSDHEQPGFTCPGCSAKATHIVYAFQGTPQEHRLPMCESHLHGDFLASLAAMGRPS